jgi:mono/diheme cytochrome c family protein
MRIRFGQVAAPTLLALCSLAAATAGQARSEPVLEEAAETRPVRFTRESIARGKVLYARHCTECHGRDGRALMDVISDATDLTSPRLWFSGTDREEVFDSIRDGAGESMPPYSAEFDDSQIWDLVNFTQSLWPEADRPPLQEK